VLKKRKTITDQKDQKIPLMKRTEFNIKAASASLGVLAGLIANNATAANSQYFETVTSGNTYNWASSIWNSSGSSGNTSPYTHAWTAGDFARFYNAATTYTVDVNTSESMAGLSLNAASTTLNLSTTGGGSFSTVAGSDPFVANATTENIYINIPVNGAGHIQYEGTGFIYLNGANGYTGGTDLGQSGNTLLFFNNGGAFGSGSSSGIILNRTGNFSTLGNYGGTAVTVANNFSTDAANTGTSTGINFANSANSGVTYSGSWTLGTVNVNLRSSGGSTAPITLSGPISGSGALTLDANGASTTILSGANTFTGTVTVYGSGHSFGGTASTGVTTLQLGAANVLSTATGLTLAGGTLNLGGFNQSINGTLNVTANSTILFGDPPSLTFTGVASGWTGVLDLADWQQGDSLFVGIGATINSADIEFDGISPSQDVAYVNPAGYIVPEPSSVALSLIGGLGFLGMAWKSRRKA
jgi:hypothetical protein